LLLRGLIAYVLGIELATQAIFGMIDIPFVDVPALEVGFGARPITRGVFLEGAVIGALYAFVAMGLILVYRANRIINFAQAQLGAVPAVIALLLVARQGVSYLWVVPIVVFGGAILGAGTEVVLVRRFRDASRLVLTVATIGIGFLLLVLEFYVKVWLPGQLQILTPDEFPTPFRDLTFNVGLTRFFGDHVAAIAIAVVTVIGLGLFFRRSDVGIAVRAAAENRDRAALLGIPVARVATIVWALAGVVSALAVFLRAPLVGLSLEGFVGPIFLLFGLAAAVIARMEHLPTALIAGVLIGMVDNAVIFATRRNSLALATMLLVILGALLLQRRRRERARDVAASTWDAVRSIRPVPPELRSLREVRWARFALGVGAVVFALAIPWLIGTPRTGFAITATVYAMVGVSLVILTGWAGQISLGQYAVSGIGAAVAGGLAANHGVDFFVTLVVAGLAGAAVAIVIGLPALRIQGLFLAVTTLAFAFAVEHFVLRREYFGWLLPGDFSFVRPPVLWGRIDLGAESEVAGVTVPAQVKYYWVCLVFLLLALGLARSLRRYRSGRVLIGLRDNEPALQAYGVSPAVSRLTAFAISGFIAAVAGALIVYHLGTVAPGAFPPEQSIQLFVMTVIGGIGSLLGPILGALFLEGLPQIPGLRDVDLIRVLTTGIGVLLVLMLLPGGLAEAALRLRDRFLRWVAGRRGLVVPSLVADVRVIDQDETHELLVAAGRAEGDA
jgi:branched-chain amino acid transport system permease protein